MGRGATGPQAAAPDPEATVRQAIMNVVREKMGPEADVRLEDLDMNRARPAADGEGSLFAKAEPGARAARTTRFSLTRRGTVGASRPAGYVLARVQVTARHARASRDIARGETLRAEDLIECTSDVGSVLMQRLPAAGDLIGTRTLRPIAAGEVLTRTAVAVRPAVQSGDVVSVRAVGDGVAVQAQGVAAQSGDVGAVIRVVNPSSRRGLTARVLAPGKVEVLQ